MARDRRQEDLDLLRRAVEAERKDKEASKKKRKGGGGSSGTLMYRGQPVAGRGGGRTPGAPSGGRPQPQSSGASSGSEDVRDALQKLTKLYQDGLITTAEYDAKRADILSRL